MSLRFGFVTAFNRTPEGHFAISNQPSSFYFGLGDGHLFTDPLRSAFPNQLAPILYSETWGDYWEYFAVYGKDTRVISGWTAMPYGKPPKRTIARLAADEPVIHCAVHGSSELIGLFPTLLALAAYLLGVAELVKFLRQREPAVETVATSFLVLVVAASFAGYLWF